jgi:DNA-binding NarL/FixJ family response regulator
MLVDDHGLFRESLSRLLQAESDLQIVTACGSIEEGLLSLARERIDLVLLDYDLGEKQGTAFLAGAQRRSFPGKILMVTAGMSDADTLRALEEGAAGIFLKHNPPSQLIEAIHRVIQGEVWLDSKAVRALVAGAHGRGGAGHSNDDLSARERLVLRCVFEGLTNKEIAGKMQMSESSVKAVLQQLFDKTGVRTRSQLVRIALEKHSADWLSE